MEGGREDGQSPPTATVEALVVGHHPLDVMDVDIVDGLVLALLPLLLRPQLPVQVLLPRLVVHHLLGRPALREAEGEEASSSFFFFSLHSPSLTRLS